MEKGLKNLQTTARTAQRKATAGPSDSFSDQGTTDRNSDSGIAMCSDTEMDVGDDTVGPSHTKNAASWHAHTGQQHLSHQDHVRTRSLPQPLLPPLKFPDILHPNSVNVNASILSLYIRSIVPRITKDATLALAARKRALGIKGDSELEDDGNYGSATTIDVEILQVISKRVHYGNYPVLH